MSKIILAGIIALAFFITVNGAYALTCSVVPPGSCSGTPILGMYSQYNSHAGLIGQDTYPYVICCSESGVTLGTSCSGTYSNYLDLWSTYNSHVEEYTEGNYGTNACLSASGVTGVSCSYRSSSCISGEACLASIYQVTDSHISDCSDYPIKICCRFSTDTTPPTVTISGISGWTNDDTPSYSGTATDSQSNIQSVIIYDYMVHGTSSPRHTRLPWAR
jgi:hypothetical protein